MKMYARIMLASGALSIAMTFAWVMAFLSCANRHPAAVPILTPPIINHQSPTIDYPPSIIDGRFIVSTLDRSTPEKNAKRYHLPTCSYAKKITDHRRTFSSEEEAQAAGYEPCSRCLPNQIVRTVNRSR